MSNPTDVKPLERLLDTTEPWPPSAPLGLSVSFLWPIIWALIGLVRDLQADIEDLRAEVRLQRAKRFGRSSERQAPAAEAEPQSVTGEPAAEQQSAAGEPAAAAGDSDRDAAAPGGRKRGGQPGHRGVGRSIPEHLEREVKWVDLPQAERQCPHCQTPYRELSLTEDAEEVDVQVKVRVIHYRRKRYEKVCDCAEGRLVTAPVPPKLIAKGKFSLETWVKFLLDKYQAQVPITRQIQMLHQVDLPVSKGTVHGGFRKLAQDYLPALYEHFLAHLRTAVHLHADETRWLVFEDVAGKTNHRWWLWVFASSEVAAFVLDPSRSADVPRQALGEKLTDGQAVPAGQTSHTINGATYVLPESLDTISADRYRVYPAISDQIQVAFCWAHQRRDFTDLKKACADLPQVVAWADVWLADIAALYALNARRLAVRAHPDLGAQAHAELEAAIAAMAEKMRAREGLTERQSKVLASVERHWTGLTLFVDHPDIPMDNNLAERLLRGPVVGRKNYYGHQAQWAGELAAMMFTIIQTCQLNGINPFAFLVSYFEACAEQGAAPTDLTPFSPWRLKKQAPSENLQPP